MSRSETRVPAAESAAVESTGVEPAAVGRAADKSTGDESAAVEGDEPDNAPTITVYPNGPLVLRGDVRLRDVDGNVIERRSGAVALCRCGLSKIKPFCDSTHKRSTFRAD